MTDKRTSFHPDAIEEAEAAARWYRQRSKRAAARFVIEVNQAIERIAAAPKRWPLGPRGTRKVKLPCFPFFVIYRESDTVVQILAIAHGRRRPHYWKTRL
jgi:plasmid stabilization system protein ParE